MSKISISVSEAGDNLFIDGLSGRMGSVHLVPALKREDLKVEPKGRAFLSVTQQSGQIIVSIENKQGVVLAQTTGAKGQGPFNITFDPWDTCNALVQP